jgi:hypothetical protein
MWNNAKKNGLSVKCVVKLSLNLDKVFGNIDAKRNVLML